MAADSHLAIALATAVPLWVLRLREQPWAQIAERLPELGTLICEHGDVILFGSKKRGEAAEGFNALAEAIAALSFVPGGITIFGQHWENRHPEITAGTR